MGRHRSIVLDCITRRTKKPGMQRYRGGAAYGPSRNATQNKNKNKHKIKNKGNVRPPTRRSVLGQGVKKLGEGDWEKVPGLPKRSLAFFFASKSVQNSIFGPKKFQPDSSRCGKNLAKPEKVSGGSLNIGGRWTWGGDENLQGRTLRRLRRNFTCSRKSFPGATMLLIRYWECG